MSNLTITITACDRLDLLERTIKSFLKFNTYPIANYIVRDDSGLQNVWNETNELFNSLNIPFYLMPVGQVGQAKSIDTMLDMVRTKYIFHLEDDWEFTRNGFIEDCFKVIDKDTAQVWVRSHNDGCAAKIGEEIEKEGVKANIVENHNFSFNPHLRKMNNNRFEGKNETMLSEWVRNNNLKTIWLKEGACRHIGGSKTTNRPGTPYFSGVKKA